MVPVSGHSDGCNTQFGRSLNNSFLRLLLAGVPVSHLDPEKTSPVMIGLPQSCRSPDWREHTNSILKEVPQQRVHIGGR